MSDNGFIDNGVKCGKCKEQHKNAAEVKLCYMEAKAAQEATTKTIDLATEKQVQFIRKLRQERGLSINEAIPNGPSRANASALIAELLAMPKAPAAKAAKAAPVELEDGIYRTVDGTIYKVYHTVHGANQQAAKVLHVTPAGTDKDGKQLYDGSFEYLGKKPLYSLTPSMLLTQEQAKQFGLVYSFCCNCTRDLTREESIHVGYGPTCAKNLGWYYPTKAELKALLMEQT